MYPLISYLLNSQVACSHFTGNVSIGGTTSTYKLDVSGTINCNNLYRSGVIADLTLISDITTIGTGQASKVLTLDSFRNVVNVVSLAVDTLVANTATNILNINPTTLQIKGTTLTATATQLDVLNGFTGTTSNLNVLSGTSATSADLTNLNAITASATELNTLTGVVAGTAGNGKAVVLSGSGSISNINTLSTKGVITAGGPLDGVLAAPQDRYNKPFSASACPGQQQFCIWSRRYDSVSHSGATESALGPITYSVAAIFGRYIGCTAMATTSDRRLKRNIQPCPIDRVKRLYDQCEVKLYDWIESENQPGQKVGLIAQDLVSAHLTDLISVFYRDDIEEGEDPSLEPGKTQLNVDYSRIRAYNMKMIQHLIERGPDVGRVLRPYQSIERWEVSPLSSKKYRVWIRLDTGKLKKVDFGAKGYAHNRDQTPLKAYSHLDHNDPERRKRYYLRHKVDYPPYSADFL
ncbi:hypothetical protein ON010_g14578 [Phytophthora cinnamomi]|nr:hypothetical protein ON010_g14578 [Phytophthora cinnamomi]